MDVRDFLRFFSQDKNNSSKSSSKSKTTDFELTDIPKIMRANEWIKGAELMEKWFASPAYTYPHDDSDDPTFPNDTTIVTLQWALKYSNLKELYDEMWNDEIYINAAARIEIEALLHDKNLFVKNTATKFGNLNEPIQLINRNDEFYVQNRTSGSIFETASGELDGMVAALANVSFRMAVEGEVIHKGKQDNVFGLFEDELYEMKINRVGIYLKDSYDFMGDQLGGLGYWNPTNNEVNKMFGGDSFHKITNASFREWRAKHNKGGDFVVFSDMEIRDVNQSWVIEK